MSVDDSLTVPYGGEHVDLTAGEPHPVVSARTSQGRKNSTVFILALRPAPHRHLIHS
jgi:hypothetical protein